MRVTRIQLGIKVVLVVKENSSSAENQEAEDLLLIYGGPYEVRRVIGKGKI